MLGDVQFKPNAEGVIDPSLKPFPVVILAALGNAVVEEALQLSGIALALGIDDKELNRVLTTKTFSARYEHAAKKITDTSFLFS